MKSKVEDEIENKLEYIGLDLDNVPETLKLFDDIKFSPKKKFEENKYRQYRYVPIKDIEILLSPTNRMDSIEEKYSKASSVYNYLVPDTEENLIRHATFLKMLKKVNIQDIEKIEEEQKELNAKVPFKVKYPGNYLWQIYYSENTGKYFMLVPTEDSDYSTFFFLLKKQIEKKRAGKIFVPISYIDYTRGIFTDEEIKDMENYLWLLTKDWPSIYEVHSKTESITFELIGETGVYDNIKTPYKVILKNKEEANKFYKLLKFLFILQTELPHYYKFSTNINNSGELEFYYENQIITYDILIEFINQEYQKLLENEDKKEQEKNELKEKLQKLQAEELQIEADYIEKEKQISTYLECKKTFFGKVKYFFKYSKKSKKTKNKTPEKLEQNIEEKVKIEEKEEKSSKIQNYTLEELVYEYREYSIIENECKNLIMDINAIKLKIKNISKKVQNATKFIEEIDKHKRSIFEFWRYSNKDELKELPEGEEEPLNVKTQIKKYFDFEENFESFGKEMDKIQRKVLTKEELDSIFVSTTYVLTAINALLAAKETTKKDTETSLKKLKEELSKLEQEREEFNIFGNLLDDKKNNKTIANKKHREQPKDIFEILEIDKNTKITEYKFKLDVIIKNIKEAIEKITLNQDIIAYKTCLGETIDNNSLNEFNLNIEDEIKQALKQNENKINLYKLNIPKEQNAIACTNSVFYDNQNKTLPVGMDLSTKVLVYDTKISDKFPKKPSKIFKVACYEDEKNELSKIKIKTINLYEN
ncbi:MAG: hypothetical protein IJV31_09210 [Clostridia bacterium]|nr:hypothetical protein [Clostridia bacterium]